MASRAHPTLEHSRSRIGPTLSTDTVRTGMPRRAARRIGGMAWRRARPAEPARPRLSRHGRHGREGRSPVVRPPLPPLDTRVDRFDLAVGTAAEFLRSAWEELREVSFEIADM